MMRRRGLAPVSALPQAEVLVQEFLNFRVRIDVWTGRDSYAAWRESDHDDLILALAVALWWAERHPDYRPEDFRVVRR